MAKFSFSPSIPPATMQIKPSAPAPLPPDVGIPTFISPQTGAVYIIFVRCVVWICFRELGNGTYRVRIQGEAQELNDIAVLLCTPSVWGSIKDGDHLSTDVTPPNLRFALADAAQAAVHLWLS